MTNVLNGLDPAQQARVAALRAEGRFFWLDVSLSETSRDGLVEALGVPEGALRALPGSGDAHAARMSTRRRSVAFTLRCYVERGAPAAEAAYRLRGVEVRVVVTSDYLLTLHQERLALPAVLAPSLPEDRSKRYVVYTVLDAMLETTFDALGEVELTLEGLTETWARRRRPACPGLGEAFERQLDFPERVVCGLEHRVEHRVDDVSLAALLRETGSEDRGQREPLLVKRQQVVARDHDAHLDWSQPVGGLVGRRPTLDVAPEREGDGLSVGVERPRGVSVTGPRQSAKGALGNTQRLDETVAARSLSETSSQKKRPSARRAATRACCAGSSPLRTFVTSSQMRLAPGRHDAFCATTPE